MGCVSEGHDHIDWLSKYARDTGYHCNSATSVGQPIVPPHHWWEDDVG